MAEGYVHGYHERETSRLCDQAHTLNELLHGDTVYPPGSRVLEAGCGVGAQTVILARNSPGAEITSMDISLASLALARAHLQAEGIDNVRLKQGDIFHPAFAPGSFDHVFLCFVLEHLPNPGAALAALKNLLRPGGTITLIEGDHGSAFFYPESPAAVRAVKCLGELQSRTGGNALIGRQLFPLLTGAGFRSVRVSPRMVYVDADRPDLVEGFTKNTFRAMIEGVRDAVLAAGLCTAREFDQGLAGLSRTADSDGVFCYTFFKAIAEK